MIRILVLNGPNLNLLGERDPGHYGTATLEDINRSLEELASKLGVEVICAQSNHEGVLIDLIHEHRKDCDGIIINPAALTHYSYALHDAIETVKLPTVEVHLSNIHEREEWRRNSVITPVAWKIIAGKGPTGYPEALEMLVEHLNEST